MYPVGTKCVVTRTFARSINCLGTIVVCQARTWNWGKPYLDFPGFGYATTMQDIYTKPEDCPDESWNVYGAYPIDWMLPLDPDETIEDLVEDIVELTHES